MLLSNRRIMEGLGETLRRLQTRMEIPVNVRFELKVAELVLSNLAFIESSDGTSMREYAAKTADLANRLKVDVPRDCSAEQEIKTLLDEIAAAASRVGAMDETGAPLKQAFMEFVSTTDSRFSAIAQLDAKAAEILLTAYTGDLLAQYNNVSLLPPPANSSTAAHADATDALDAARLTAYFRNVLNDASANASNLVTLDGGFGKETTLFNLQSKSMNADLVMRRDPLINPLTSVDCHTALEEYPLLRALHARGFPVPEPLFFGDGLGGPLKGRAFSVVRRVTGSIVGDSSGSANKVPREPQRTLATAVARLHSVAALTELTDNPAFPAEHWTRSAADNTRHYIASWYKLFRTAPHLPAPPLHGLFNWLLAHVPDTTARSSLVHGDIGFHNLMLDGSKLSAVLDWEFAHVGDPAEDIGYIRSGMGEQLDWQQFLLDYKAAGGAMLDETRVRYFEIWSNVRNAAAGVLFTAPFESGEFREIKYGMIVYQHVPYFLLRAQKLIASFERG